MLHPIGFRSHPGAPRRSVSATVASIGDLAPGIAGARYRKCGKPNCHCAAEGHPDHGPSGSLTRGVRGKTVTRVIPASMPSTPRRAQIGECRRLRRLTGELIEVSEQLCHARIQTADAEAGGPQVKKSLRGAVCPGD